MWKVYKLTNVSLNECFAGVTDGDPQDCLREVANGGVETVDHWDAEEHKITHEVLKEFPAEFEAVEFLGDVVAKDGCLKAV